MEINFYRASNDSIQKVEKDIKPEDWIAELNWVHIQTKERKIVIDYLKEQDQYQKIMDCIEHPEAYPFSNSFENILILNFLVSNPTDMYKADYISVILNKNLIVTIIPEASGFFTEKILSIYSQKKYTSFDGFLFFILVTEIQADNNANLGRARKRIQDIEHVLSTNPDELSSGELMECERDINQLSDIIEDQYIGFEIMASLSSPYLSQAVLNQTQNIIKGFDPLDKAVTRLEKKAESLRLHYMLIQQERSSRKINVLTIIQAIFVPLTFIAGVYGMNFTNMPELNFHYGYFVVLFSFVLIASSLLVYFNIKGWFN